ncbi:hypothetical protein [Mycolicibacterium sp. XJ1819]
MHSTGKLFATTMIAAAGAVSAALALSATAGAQPAPTPPAPAVPGLPFLQQLANPAAATQLMQGVTTLLGSAQTPAAPATPPPSATASVTLPQPSSLPGAAAPLNTPATTAPATTPQNVLSGLPTGLASLMPQGLPLSGLLPSAPATTPAAPVATAPAPVFSPLSALP